LRDPCHRDENLVLGTADGTAIAKKDYVAAHGVLTYPPGQTLQKITIELPKAKKVEDLVEYFFVELANASPNAVILKRGVVHVVDDDVPNGNSSATGVTLARSAARPATISRPIAVWSALPISDDIGDDDELASLI